MINHTRKDKDSESQADPHQILPNSEKDGYLFKQLLHKMFWHTESLSKGSILLMAIESCTQKERMAAEARVAAAMLIEAAPAQV